MFAHQGIPVGRGEDNVCPPGTASVRPPKQDSSYENAPVVVRIRIHQLYGPTPSNLPYSSSFSLMLKKWVLTRVKRTNEDPDPPCQPFWSVVFYHPTPV